MVAHPIVVIVAAADARGRAGCSRHDDDANNHGVTRTRTSETHLIVAIVPGL